MIMNKEVSSNTVNLSPCLGRWVNPYKESKGITEFSLVEDNGKLFIDIEGAESGRCSGVWERVAVRHYAYAPDLNDVVAFKAHLNRDDMDILLAINENKGLLVVAAYFTLKDGDERSDFFIREFFHKKEALRHMN